MRNTRKNPIGVYLFLIILQAVAITALLKTPGYIRNRVHTREAIHIHTAKVVESAVRDYLKNANSLPGELETLEREPLRKSSRNKELVQTNGYVLRVKEEPYYELTYDFIKELNIDISEESNLSEDKDATIAPVAIYASNYGTVMVHKEKGLRGYDEERVEGVSHEK